MPELVFVDLEEQLEDKVVLGALIKSEESRWSQLGVA